MAYDSLNPRVVNDMKQWSWRMRADGQNRMTNDRGTCHFDCQVLIVCTNMREMSHLMFHDSTWRSRFTMPRTLQYGCRYMTYVFSSFPKSYQPAHSFTISANSLPIQPSTLVLGISPQLLSPHFLKMAAPIARGP